MAYGMMGDIKIVSETTEESFVRRVHELLQEGFMPANALETFAEWDDDGRQWQTLFVMAFFRDHEEGPPEAGGGVELRQMFS